MANLLTFADFKLDINLRINNADDGATVDAWITEHEQPFIKAILGTAFAALFGDGSAAPYDDLLPYVKYCAARYIFWMYKRGTAYPDAVAGSVKPKAENATMVNAGFNMVKAWDQMVDKLRELYAYLAANTDIYPDFDLSLVATFYYQTGQYIGI